MSLPERGPLPALLDAIDQAQLAEADAAAWRRWVRALVAGDAEDQVATTTVVNNGVCE